jgi:8-oxo-dGTP diphosphatase
VDDRSREYPRFPLVGVGALITEGNRVVLVRRAKQPSQGEWSIPGGLVNVGETLREAVVREAFEETGLFVEPKDLVELLDRIVRDDEGRVHYHYVLADFLCEVRGGSLIAGSDASAARWADRADLQDFGLAPVTLRVILKGLNAR